MFLKVFGNVIPHSSNLFQTWSPIDAKYWFITPLDFHNLQ